MGFGAELKEAVMNPNVRTILGMIAGIGIGAAGVQVLHATNHAPVYYVAEQDISNRRATRTNSFREQQPSSRLREVVMLPLAG